MGSSSVGLQTTAVAVAGGGHRCLQTAALAMASPVVTYDDIIRIPNPRQPWTLNNTALKSLRDSHEDPPWIPNRDLH